jgi:two-component system response regulator AtoC
MVIPLGDDNTWRTTTPFVVWGLVAANCVVWLLQLALGPSFTNGFSTVPYEIVHGVDLVAEVKAGRFREDLFYRLNVLPIVVPPLRARREDIPLLIDHFVAKNNARLGTSIRGLDTEARRVLCEYGWPGNVRELENSIERAMVLSEGDLIVAADLPDRIREARDPMQVQLASGELSIKKTTRVIEEMLIRRALQKTKGNRTRAAEVLELSHRALLYKIKDYKITDL